MFGLDINRYDLFCIQQQQTEADLTFALLIIARNSIAIRFFYCHYHNHFSVKWKVGWSYNIITHVHEHILITVCFL